MRFLPTLEVDMSKAGRVLVCAIGMCLAGCCGVPDEITPAVPPEQKLLENPVKFIAGLVNAGAPPHDYNLGETFALGGLSYKVISRSSRSVMSKGDTLLVAADGEEGEEQFVVVRYQETNQSDETKTVSADVMRLQDSNRHTYRPAPMATGRRAMAGTALRPGATRRATVVFQIPSKANGLGVLLVISARGMAGTASKRVLLRSRDEELAAPGKWMVGLVVSELEERNFGYLRRLMTPEDSAKVTNATMEEWSASALKVGGMQDDRILTVDRNTPVTVDGELVSTTFKLGRKGRSKIAAIVAITCRHRDRSYYLVDIRIRPPRGRGRRRQKANRSASPKKQPGPPIKANPFD